MLEIIKSTGLEIWEFVKPFWEWGRPYLDFIHPYFDSLFYFFLILGAIISLIYIIMSVYSKLEDKKGKKFLDKGYRPKVTIQIPTRNEIIALRCAKKCLEFDYPRDKVQILIGDDSDKPDVSSELMEFAEKHSRVEVIKRDKNIGFKPGNLNNMLKYSTGEIIVVFDSDFAPGKDFLKRIVQPFSYSSEISGVQARWSFLNQNQNLVTLLGAAIVDIFHHISLLFLKRYNCSFLCGSAEALRKSDLVKAGGWRSGSLTEDIEYSLRIYKNNKRVYYLSELECLSEVPSKAKDLYRQQKRWAYGVISSYKTHGKELLFSKTVPVKKRIVAFTGAFGYLIPVVITLLFLAGFLSFITNTPAAINFPKFFSETFRNILLTSGLILATTVALWNANKLKFLPKTIISSFSYGFVTIYHVNIGIVKAILNKPMQWFLLSKSKKY